MTSALLKQPMTAANVRHLNNLQNRKGLTMTNDLSKLPKWAQEEFKKLEFEAERWRTLALAGPPESDTFLDEGSIGSQGRPLGKSVRVAFGTETLSQVSVRLDSDGWLRIHGDRSIIVRPQASNLIYVQLEERNR